MTPITPARPGQLLPPYLALTNSSQDARRQQEDEDDEEANEELLEEKRASCLGVTGEVTYNITSKEGFDLTNSSRQRFSLMAPQQPMKPSTMMMTPMAIIRSTPGRDSVGI